MFDKLKDNLNNSYSPYSNFKVSAIVVTKDNKYFAGVNIENKSFGGTICAERVAILKAISEGHKEFKEIHILGSEKAYPCFICRQTFTEFFDKDTKIFIYDIDGTKEEYSMEAMCPYPFDGEL